jgi:hypothetical protein
MSSSVSTTLVTIDRRFTDHEELALTGFLAGYRGTTREAYALDLRQFVVWCTKHERRLFEVHRVDIECFGRDWKLEGGLARPSPVDCARLQASTAMQERKASLPTRLRSMCDGPGSTTSRTRLVSTATSSALRVCHRLETTRWSRSSH